MPLLMDVRRKYQHRIVFQRDMLKAITHPSGCFPEEKQLEEVGFERRILINTPRKRSCVSVLMLKSTPHSVLLKGTYVSSLGLIANFMGQMYEK